MRKVICVLGFFLFSSVVLADEVSAPQAYEWGVALTLEGVNNLQGGIKKGTKTLGNLDATLTIDTGAADWWENGTLFVYALGDYGKSPSELTGDTQGLSNIATDNAAKIYEFWYEHSFADDAFKVLVGLHDYNSTFYSLDSAGLFTMSSFGIGADTAQVGPSIFATTSTAIHLTFKKDKFYGLLAVYDGVPGDPENPRGTHIQFDDGDGLFKAAEIGLTEDKSYKVGLGFWQKTTEEENVVDGTPLNSNHGFYFIGEKHLSDDLVAFLQYGRADEKKNQLDQYWGTGLTLNNALATDDALGLGVGSAHNGTPFLDANDGLKSSETIWELTYLRPIIEHLNLQTSVYYIDSPSMDPDVDNALALGLRLYIEF
jgi:porin